MIEFGEDGVEFCEMVCFFLDIICGVEVGINVIDIVMSWIDVSVILYRESFFLFMRCSK